jgi:hypothetical protein
LDRDLPGGVFGGMLGGGSRRNFDQSNEKSKKRRLTPVRDMPKIIGLLQ